MKFRIAALAAMLVLTMTAAAQAATFNVTTTSDDNPANVGDCPPDAANAGCSLREAVYAANDTPGDDRINLPAGDYVLTNDVSDADGDPDLDLLSRNNAFQATGALAIVGNSARDTTIRSDRATDDRRVFHIEGGRSDDPDGGGAAPCADTPGQAFELRNLRINEGFTDDDGGGVSIDDVDSDCAGNDTEAFDARVALVDVAVTNNFVSDGSNGGGIYNEGELSLDRVLVASNQSGDGYGGGIYNADTLSMVNTTIAGNSADENGGGIVTVPYDQEAGDDGIVQATNVTLALNDTGYRGGGLSREGQRQGPVGFALRNTIIANNTANRGSDNCHGPANVISEGFNLETTDQCGLDGPGDKTNTDAGLLSRGNYGGQTDTYALSEPSPARDAGTNEDCPGVDQRGVARPIGPSCDIGAFEAPLPAPPQPPTVVREVVEVPTAFQRVSPRGLSLTVRKTRPTTRSLRLRSTGRVALPAGLTAAQACTFGFVAVQVKANGKTVSTRIVSIRRNCRYTSQVTFNALSRIRNRTLTVRARFFGNDRLRTRFSPKRSAGRA